MSQGRPTNIRPTLCWLAGYYWYYSLACSPSHRDSHWPRSCAARVHPPSPLTTPPFSILSASSHPPRREPDPFQPLPTHPPTTHSNHSNAIDPSPSTSHSPPQPSPPPSSPSSPCRSPPTRLLRHLSLHCPTCTRPRGRRRSGVRCCRVCRRWLVRRLLSRHDHIRRISRRRLVHSRRRRLSYRRRPTRP